MNQYIGKILDNRYEILDVIGVGGMAVVYKAYCHRLHRFVAIKILKRDLAADAEFRRRFHEEAQAVAMLSHPNIVSVYDVSKGDDLDYIVMELIDGITLKQYMQKKQGRLNWRESLYFITQIVRALGHAHSRGIIHRDIKPQNIMVLRDGSVKVADFGIARIMSAAQTTLRRPWGRCTIFPPNRPGAAISTPGRTSTLPAWSSMRCSPAACLLTGTRRCPWLSSTSMPNPSPPGRSSRTSRWGWRRSP